MWIIGDYNAEMITALCALGVAVENIRAWDIPRSSYSPQLLQEERPDWLFMSNGFSSTSHGR